VADVSRVTTRRLGRPVRGLGAALVGALILLAAGCGGSGGLGAAATGGVPLTVSPSPGGNSYHNGQSITVDVGPNSKFTPNLRLNILECADPGGSSANLPKSVANCDGNTIQGNSILPKKDGSFTQPGYVIFKIPTSQFGESAAQTPICDQHHACVLYIGENQEDFTQPKIFSAPFTVTP
jgi:hypothetical protein